MSGQIKDWQELERSLLQKTRVFDLYSKRMKSPKGDYEDDFFFIEAPDWVNIIALTDERKVVMIRQFRHGVSSVCLEIPGGILDERGEIPLQAATRELLEETGYEVESVKPLGFCHPNPAIQVNRCFFFLGTGAKKTSDLNLDPAEDIETTLIPLTEIPDLILSGEVSHTLVNSAFLNFFFLEGKNYPELNGTS